ncbi:hypothetical protein [Desulfonema magnum]|uniref:Porin domain-containing protein n=1 Tax=Desulfonema magnum TaxID=45655 RepID=A0A975GRN0_9BACT|nr:hypothetical protein [Desulfonema magnum]QTA91095.1 porin domain-containing protein [Desulfonema magnum]
MKKIFCWVLMMLNVGTNVHAFDPDQIQIHGFVSQGYLISDNNDYMWTETEDGSFQFNEMGINFATQLTDDLRVGLQFLSRDLGEIGNNEVELDWAFADYHFRDWLGLRVGRMKLRYGFYNQSRDIDAARTWILLPMSVYDELTRELYTSVTGIGIYGEIHGGLSYEFQIGPFDLDEKSGLAKMTSDPAREDLISIDSESDNLVLGLEWKTPLEGLKIGATYKKEESSVEANTLEIPPVPISRNNKAKITTGSVEYAYEDFVFSAEYRHRELNIRMGERTLVKDRCEEGYYAAVQYRFTDWLELGSYYAVIYADKDDKNGDGYEARGLPREEAWQKDIALSARFDINDYWIFKLESHFMDGLYRVDYDPSDPEDQWILFAAKMTFSF